MKNLYKVPVLAIAVILIGCYSGDYNNRYVALRIQDALTIENEGNYSVGDTIFFELNFSRYLPEEGYSNLLDIFESTDAKEFTYSFDLTKSSDLANDYQRVTIAPGFIFAEKGEVSPFNIEATAVLNEDQDTYESRIGIILVEEGDFRFDFEYINLYNRYVQDKIQLEIIHDFSASSTANFDFTVSE